MDFITYPKDRKGYDTVFIIMDQLSKAPISIPYQKETTAKEMAWLWLRDVFQWTGPPDSIISDQGGQFMSEFWSEVCRYLEIKLKLSTAHHPQTNKQTEITNQYLSQKLKAFVSHAQNN
jgi:transposase InsO family protein